MLVVKGSQSLFLALQITWLFCHHNVQNVYSFAPQKSLSFHHDILSSSTTLQSTSEETTTTASANGYAAPLIEIDRRRNLAIISHPDSGKTTMTEKLLLYGGAIQQAGAVRQKAEQR